MCDVMFYELSVLVSIVICSAGAALGRHGSSQSLSSVFSGSSIYFSSHKIEPFQGFL